MDKIIIDTSAWIDAFRPKAKKGLGLLVKDLILQDRVLMPGIIKAELLRGTRTKSEFDRLSDLLKGITYLSVLPFKLDDTLIVILKEVPVLQCKSCSEYLLDDDVLSRVDEILAKVDPAAELEIIKYAA